MPCHMSIDYDDEDWQTTQYPDADICAGTLIHFRNYLKTPRDPGMAAAVRAVEPSPNVFASPGEFFEHHAPDADEGLVSRALWAFGSDTQEW